MASRDLIMRIPKEKYEKLIQKIKSDSNFRECEIIKLQKGHGKIVDANCVLKNCDCWETETALQLTEAIIEADYSDDNRYDTAAMPYGKILR